MSDKNTNADILLAGAFAAFTVDLLVYPLDTLKTRFQSPDYAARHTHGPAGTINRAALFRGLYQGVGSVIIATLPSSGAFFTTYEGSKSLLTTHNPTLGGTSSPLLPQPLIHALASSAGELVSCAILTPAEVIKQNAQMVNTASPSSSPSSSPGSSRSSASSRNATLQTLARFRANPLALWRGYAALAGRNLPFTALQFPLFERMKEGLKAWRERAGTRTGTLLESGLITAVSAGTAGSVAAVVTTPVDVVKTRIMLAAGDGAGEREREGKGGKGEGGRGKGLKDALGGVREKTARKGSWAVGKEVFAKEGVRGLFRGGALRAVWTMLGSGLYLGVYESGRIWLARRRGMDISEDELL